VETNKQQLSTIEARLRTAGFTILSVTPDRRMNRFSIVARCEG